MKFKDSALEKSEWSTNRANCSKIALLVRLKTTTKITAKNFQFKSLREYSI